MKNRLFYIGLGCVLSTLLWTILAATPPRVRYLARESEVIETLFVGRLYCHELSVLNKDNEEVMAMLDMSEGATLAIRETDPKPDDREYVFLRADALSFFNKLFTDANKKQKKEFVD